MLKKILTLVLIVLAAMLGGAFASFMFSSKDAVGESAHVPSQQVQETEVLEATSSEIQDGQAQQGKPVQVAQVTQENIELVQTFYGTAIPFAEMNVQTKHGGQITFLKGKEGDRIEAGEAIARFDKQDTNLQLQQAIAGKNSALQSVNQAESNYATIQTDLKRYQQLLKDGFVSRQNVDSLQNQLQVAQANLQSAREQVKNADATIQILKNTLKDMVVTAPISGLIDEKNFNLNEIAGAEDVLYHLVNIDQVYIEAEIPETYISEIHEQMPVNVAFDSMNGRRLQGIVERMIPTGNSQSRNFTVKVLVDNPEQLIKPGMFARVEVSLETIQNALMVNKKALLKEGDNYYVFKVNGTQVEKVEVRVKHRDGQRIAVLSDVLHPQDRIVVEGVRMLQADDRVHVL
jgi:RND family efflux transporter MFP subunit